MPLQKKENGLPGPVRRLFWSENAITPVEPVVHINCRGCAELENCTAVTEYEPDRISFQAGRYRVEIQGEGLTILSLNQSVTRLSGQIFRVTFTERMTDGTA